MLSKSVLTCILILMITVLSPIVSAQEEDQTYREDSFLHALSHGKIKALLRYNGEYRNSSLHVLQDGSATPPEDERKQQYSAFGGYFGYETAAWNKLTFGATLYGAAPIGNNPADRAGLGGLYEDDGDQDAYAALGELYASYRTNGHLLKIGRQEMPAYRFVSLSNVRFSPVTHSGAIYENNTSDKLGIKMGYIMRMKERNAKKFIGMARGARLGVSNNGKPLIRGEYNPDDYEDNEYTGKKGEMAMLGLTYQAGDFSLEAWDYYIGDFLNTLYLSGKYSTGPLANGFQWSVAAQYGLQKDVGSHIAGNIDTWFYGLNISGSRKALSFFGSYNRVDYNENSYDGGTMFVRWGTPQMFNSFQVQDSELAGTKSAGVGIQYDFGRNGLIPGVVMRWRYARYNMPDDLDKTDARQDREEATFDLRYSFSQKSGFGIFTQMKGLSLQFRVAFNNYRTSYDFEAYRQIHGYEFESVTKDFVDTRLYLDYIF